jgi:5-methylcytosine-specific restriction endonuclease McrA
MSERICSIEGCESLHMARGFCTKHYRRWKEHGDPLTVLIGPEAPPKICRVDDCERRARSHGLCTKHLQRMKRLGSPDAAVQDQLPKGTYVVCTIDDCGNKHFSRGYCRKHHARWREHGDPNYTREIPVCKVEGCGGKHEGKGFCQKHYVRWRKHGDPEFTPWRKFCAIEGCGGAHKGKGLCGKHLARLERYGDPHFTLFTPPGTFSECRVEGCAAKPKSVGLCGSHYRSARKYGDPTVRKVAVRGSRLSNGASKLCGRCEEDKPNESYGSNASRPDGLDVLCRECKRQADAAWSAANKVKVAEKSQKRRAVKLTRPHYVLTRKDLRRLSRSRCLACGSSEDLHVDHLIPLAREGSTHGIGNLISLCRPCNSSKSHLLWIEWKYSGRARAKQVF